MSQRRELLPLRFAALDRHEAAEARAQARLERAWTLIVGPFLATRTRLLRLHRGTLVMGCWNPELVPNLRRSAESVWPQVQERIERQLRLKIARLEVVPCDPPPPPAKMREPEPDPLDAVLRRLRQMRNPHWTRSAK